MQIYEKKNNTCVSVLVFATMLGMMLFTACTDDEVCEEVTANELRIGFYLFGEESDTRIFLDDLTVFALERPGQLIYDRQENVAVIELPLNPAEDHSAFVLMFDQKTDTLRLTYKREEHMISVECGFTLFFDITGVEYTTSHIQLISTATNYVTNSFDEHLKAYVPDPGPVID
ncbi:MAG: DUF6452 family protein [Bacteroidales bacterium]|nr:DUF6452 family protein [Bacteroidales bacterium]